MSLDVTFQALQNSIFNFFKRSSSQIRRSLFFDEQSLSNEEQINVDAKMEESNFSEKISKNCKMKYDRQKIQRH